LSEALGKAKQRRCQRRSGYPGSGSLRLALTGATRSGSSEYSRCNGEATPQPNEVNWNFRPAGIHKPRFRGSSWTEGTKSASSGRVGVGTETSSIVVARSIFGSSAVAVLRGPHTSCQLLLHFLAAASFSSRCSTTPRDSNTWILLPAEPEAPGPLRQVNTANLLGPLDLVR